MPLSGAPAHTLCGWLPLSRAPAQRGVGRPPTSRRRPLGCRRRDGAHVGQAQWESIQGYPQRRHRQRGWPWTKGRCPPAGARRQRCRVDGQRQSTPTTVNRGFQCSTATPLHRTGNTGTTTRSRRRCGCMQQDEKEQLVQVGRRIQVPRCCSTSLHHRRNTATNTRSPSNMLRSNKDEMKNTGFTYCAAHSHTTPQCNMHKTYTTRQQR